MQNGKTYWAVTRIQFADGGTYVTPDVLGVFDTLQQANDYMIDAIEYLCSSEDENWQYDGHRYNAHFVRGDYGRTVQFSVERTLYYE